MKHYEEKVLLREFLSAPPVFLMHSQTFSKYLKWFFVFLTDNSQILDFEILFM